MMKLIILINVFVLFASNIDCASLEQESSSVPLNRVFNYEGAMPIKDERTGEIKTDGNDAALPTQGTKNRTESEAACWQMIVEQSAVTFALQNRVLNELDKDLESLNLDGIFREKIESTANKMRTNMKDALEALDNGSAEEFFDSLFDSSENIVQMSSYLRVPKLDEKVFIALVKAVSRLGRNNSALIQEFTDRCSFVQLSPRPRELFTVSA